MLFFNRNMSILRASGLVMPLNSSAFDPQRQPTISQSPLRVLSPGCFQLDFIRHAFAHPFSWSVEPVCEASFCTTAFQEKSLKPAAVFMPLVQRPSGVHVLFTRRAAHLLHHAGQISFPGGRIEPTDANIAQAALRETQEEVGIDPVFVDLIGTHPGFITSSRYAMTPVIGALKPGFSVQPNHNEVAEVFEVPLSVLMDPAVHRLHRSAQPDGQVRLYFSMTWHSYFIWGATAALLRNFYRYLATAETVFSGSPSSLP